MSAPLFGDAGRREGYKTRAFLKLHFTHAKALLSINKRLAFLLEKKVRFPQNMGIFICKEAK
jgi:hypothetical protein